MAEHYLTKHEIKASEKKDREWRQEVETILWCLVNASPNGPSANEAWKRMQELTNL